ncbi:MAG: hypothetical protein ACRD2W_15735 [Acidimicrobiales bacterium]
MTLLDRTVRGPEAVDRGRLHRLWVAPLRAHLALLTLLVLAVFPFMTPSGAYTSDEGAYALQVAALERGGWEYEYRAAPHDPNGDYFPLVLSDRNGDGGYYPYAKHPAFPLLLRGAVAVFGTALGLHLLQLLAVVATAAAAWLLAAEFDGSLSRPAFWLAAASPVLVNGYLIWAHALSAAVAGFCLVAAVRVARRGLRGWPPVALAAGLVAGVLLRSEGLLFAAALVAALAWTQLRRLGVVPGAVTAAAMGVPALTAHLLEQCWAQSIVGTRSPGIGVRGSRDSGYVVGRINGAWHELGQADYGNARAAALGLIVVVAVALAWMALRRGGPRWVAGLVVASVVAVAALLIRFAVAPTEPMPGLFAAWPVALLGLAARRSQGTPEPVRLAAMTGALFLVAVVATQYAEGGGLEWGGRFFSPAISLAAVLAVVGLRDRIAERATSCRERTVAVAAVAAVAIASATLGLVTVGRTRAATDRLVAAVARHPADVTITVEPSLPRSGWRFDSQVTWMNAEKDDVAPLLARLWTDGVHQVAVVAPRGLSLDGSPYERVEVIEEPVLAARDGELLLLRKGALTP